MNKHNLILFIVLISLFPLSTALALPSLHDFAFNINGSLYIKSFPLNMDTGGFDTNTGLGTLVIQFPAGSVGSYAFKAFFDHEVQETVNGFDNEHGGNSGAATSGQSWEIGEPGYQTGNIYTHFQSGNLSNTNGIPESGRDDVSMAMGWNFSLASGEWARITMVLTQNPGQVPANLLTLSHTDPESNETVYFYGIFEKIGQPPEPPHVVETIPTVMFIGMAGMMIGIGLSAVTVMRKRGLRAKD